MRNVAVCGEKVKDLIPDEKSLSEIKLNGVPFTVGLIATSPPEFNQADPANDQHVLVRIKAFSCNFRDRAIILATVERGIENSFYPIGSEFVAEVIAVGAGVTRFQVGDRVIGDNNYLGPVVDPDGVMPGIPTNSASKEYQAFHHKKLIKIPEEMPDDQAAAFSIGAQTVYSMIRKLDLQRGANVLVTAAKSNTSLIAISALRKHQVNVYATSTSMQFLDELKALDVKELIELKIENGNLVQGAKQLADTMNSIGKFHYVIDPFFDMHLPLAVEVMEPGGRYVSCGLARQFGSAEANEPEHLPNLKNVLTIFLIRNYQLIGNCLGLTNDLERALEDYRNGDFRVVVDSVYKGDKVGEFFDRTFNSRERFGKVIFSYG